MIGSKLYQKRQRVILLLSLYGILALIGIAFIVTSISRNQDPSGAAGFMVVFGVGMCIRTFLQSRRPLVVIHEEQMELNQTSRPEFIRFTDIAGVDRLDKKRLVLTVREGHANRKTTVWLNHLSPSEAEKFADFLIHKSWKRARGKKTAD
jgi:hypothetical protein